MAFTVEQGGESKGPLRLIVGVVLVLALIITTYVLFFTRPPQIEVLAPQEVQKISKISDIELDPAAITSSPAYKALEGYIPPPELVDFGRVNPFSRF